MSWVFPFYTYQAKIVSMVDRWSKTQQEQAACIVNDIAEGIDNHESRAELRQALAIYADLLWDANQAKIVGRDKELIQHIDELIAVLDRNKSKP